MSTTDEAEAPGTAMSKWVQAHAELTPLAQQHFSVEEVRTIYKTKMSTLDAAEFQLVMAQAARYDLDPMANEIWGVRGKSRNGEPGKLLIMVGRDGLLKVARRDVTYMGADTDVVRKNDTFKVRRSKAGREIIHEYEGGIEERGAIIGAWAQVYQKGHSDTYFFAPWDEYFPNRTNDRSPWSKQPSVMIQKCALSLCLRLAFNLSGVVAEEEAAKMFEADAEVADEDQSLAAIAAQIPPQLRDRLYAAYTDAANLRTGQVTPATIQMFVGGQPDEAIEAYIEEIEQANATVKMAAARVHTEEPSEADVVEPDLPISTEGLPDPDQAEHVAALERRLSDLMDELDGEPEGIDTLRTGELEAEIAAVEAELSKRGAAIPGQEAMDLNA